MSLFLTPDQYKNPLYSCMGAIFTSYYTQFCIFRLLPIIIDIVFTLSYHVTPKNDVWSGDCFYSFFLSFLCFPSRKRLAQITFPAGNYLFKVNNKSTRTRCEICSKLTIKTPERRLASFWCLYC